LVKGRKLKNEKRKNKVKKGKGGETKRVVSCGIGYLSQGHQLLQSEKLRKRSQEREKGAVRKKKKCAKREIRGDERGRTY